MVEPLRIRYRCLSGDPIILAGPFDNPHNNFFNPEIVAALSDREAHFIVYQTASLEAPQRAAQVIDLLRQRRADNPRHRYFAMANSEAELEILRQAQLPCGLINDNALINEFFYRPDPLAEKTYDAVSNAALVPFKRVHLARDIPSLALLFVDYHRSGVDDDRYAAQLRQTLKQANFVNQPQSDYPYRWVGSREVVEWYNRCHVGLCLSASEGAMRASMEYLLCGLPVVSTPSIGGRDIFFHPSFARIVAPEPPQIADAVADLIAERVSPQHIRGYVVPRMRVMRHRFQWLVQSILDEAGVGRIFAPDWNEFLAGNWLRYDTVATLLAEIDALREVGS